jgi:hypothetical protein
MQGVNIKDSNGSSVFLDQQSKQHAMILMVLCLKCSKKQNPKELEVKSVTMATENDGTNNDTIRFSA